MRGMFAGEGTEKGWGEPQGEDERELELKPLQRGLRRGRRRRLRLRTVFVPGARGKNGGGDAQCGRGEEINIF